MLTETRVDMITERYHSELRHETEAHFDHSAMTGWLADWPLCLLWVFPL